MRIAASDLRLYGPQLGCTLDGMLSEYARLDEQWAVALPEHLTWEEAATFTCAGLTAWNATAGQHVLRPGDSVLLIGTGGVSLFALQFARLLGCRVVVVTSRIEKAERLKALGADHVVDSTANPSWGPIIAELTGGGAHLSLDALGSPATCAASVDGLRRRGRHVQVGLLPSADGTTPVPLARAVALELEILGSHGMAAHAYPAMLEAVRAGVLRPDLLVTRRIGLDAAPEALARLGDARLRSPK